MVTLRNQSRKKIFPLLTFPTGNILTASDIVATSPLLQSESWLQQDNRRSTELLLLESQFLPQPQNYLPYPCSLVKALVKVTNDLNVSNTSVNLFTFLHDPN